MEDTVETQVASAAESVAAATEAVAGNAATAVDAAAAAAADVQEAAADAAAAAQNALEGATTEQPATGGSEAASAPCGKGCVGAIVAVVVVVAVLAMVFGRRKKGGCGCGCDGSGKDAPAAGGKAVEIYVGNLSYAMTDDQLRKEFERFGVVKSARVIGHRASGKSKGYGFVEMPHRKEAEIAIKNLNNREVMGRKLRVNEARHGIPKE